MLQITTATGKLGPYKTVETLQDRFRVNGGAEIPFSAIDAPFSVNSYDGFLPPAPPAIVPDSITATQARFALIDAAADDTFNTTLTTITPQRKNKRVNAEWATAQSFARKGSAFTVVLNQMGWTKKQIDDIFIAAAVLDPVA